MLVSEFERIRMLEDETFNEFYDRINDLGNSMINLGKKVLDTKLIKKILRPLLKRFRIKVTTIEESKDLGNMKIEELVGSLLTYELSLPAVKKAKSIALKASNGKSKNSSKKESNDEDGIAMLARNFRDLLNSKGDPEGFRHIQADCGNLKQANRKALHATLSNDSNKNQRILALIEESQSGDEEELKEAYRILCVKFKELRETNKKNVMKLNTMKTEQSTLLLKITNLENKLMDAQLQLEKFSGNKLAQMLTGQKCYY
jgi:hypothetical protein